ncbi:MAG: biopolymer transporter ExbD [Prevotella sp.]|jgi:biopolymer transport protein ExbD|nr:biopolymer transporter ExbD [Prevotella sp.]MBR0527723.1 biopolymer transporter ExbD [Prevotella sp.]MBR3011571.1 biopolymer transporter ExbD [Prevotella sp.]
MGKVKIKKADIWIDMTPMSDVMVLLLTFFMMSSTFMKKEPATVTTPMSVSEIKVPETNVLNILVDSIGNIYMGMDNENHAQAALLSMAGQFGVSIDPLQRTAFLEDGMWGMPMEKLEAYLKLDPDSRNLAMKQQGGIPLDSIDGDKSEFQMWVTEARNANEDIKVAIKADQNTPYRVIKKIMGELRDMNENRYYLITSYKANQED